MSSKDIRRALHIPWSKWRDAVLARLRSSNSSSSEVSTTIETSPSRRAPRTRSVTPNEMLAIGTERSPGSGRRKEGTPHHKINVPKRNVPVENVPVENDGSKRESNIDRSMVSVGMYYQPFRKFQ